MLRAKEQDALSGLDLMAIMSWRDNHYDPQGKWLMNKNDETRLH